MDSIMRVDTPEVDGTAFNTTFRLRTDSIIKVVSTDENEIRSADSIEPVVKTTHSTSVGFDVQSVYAAFVAALKEPENPKSLIGTQDYINGYRELLK
jgi:hypothetical protein